MKKVYIVPGLWVSSIRAMFLGRGGYMGAQNIEDAHIVVWTGGADLDPSLYDERPLPCTSFSKERDQREIDEWVKVKASDKLKVGICRGGQLLNVLNKGKMWQDVNNHGSEHDCVNMLTGQLYTVSSIHHQEMIPHPSAGVVLGKAYGLATKKLKDGMTYMPVKMNALRDIEAIWYPATKSFCFQPHPEVGPDSCVDLFFDLLEAVTHNPDVQPRDNIQ